MSCEVKTTCPYCGVGCGMLVSRKGAVRGDPNHPANFGRLCSKGHNVAETLASHGRFVNPTVDGVQASWDAATTAVADRLSAIIQKHGPNSVAFYVSGQLLTEDYYVANKLIKGFIGTANIDANSRLCMASAVAGYTRAFGSDTVPTSYEDLELADVVVLVGSNTAWCHPILFQRILKAREAHPHKRIVVIDPRRTATATASDLHLAIRPGSDTVLFNGLLNHLRVQGELDSGYLEASTTGFWAALDAARQIAPSASEVAYRTGVPQAQIEAFYDLFSQASNAVSLYSQGVNQASDGADRVNAILNCHLASGQMGRPGAGPFSITGQPNAMGGREVGALANLLAAHMSPKNKVDVDRVKRFWNAPRMPQKPGEKAVSMFQRMASGRIKAVWIMATNPVVSLPDVNQTLRALSRADLVIMSECFAENDTLPFADIVLPARPWGEKDGTVTNSERRISRCRPFQAPTGDAKPDWWIVSQVAQRMGFADAFDYHNPAQIFDEHARLSAFENEGARIFNLGGLTGLSGGEYDALEPIQWPVTPAKPQGTARCFEDGRFPTNSGRARLLPIIPRRPPCGPTAALPMVLNTGRSRDQWHTMTRTGRSPTLSSHAPEPYAELHPLDARRLGLTEDDLVAVESARGRAVVRAKITTGQRPGCVFVPMHWTNVFASAGRVNVVVHSQVDPVSGQPDFKRTPVNLTAFSAAWTGFVLSRQPLDLPDVAYWVRVDQVGYTRYEIAGSHPLSTPSDWARNLLCEEDGQAEWVEYFDVRRQAYRGVRMLGDQVTSCVFISKDGHLPQRDWLGSLFAKSSLAAQERRALLAGRPGMGVEAFGPVVCACTRVRRPQIVQLATSGIRSARAIGQACGAGTQCGSCVGDIKHLLQQHPVASQASGS